MTDLYTTYRTTQRTTVLTTAGDPILVYDAGTVFRGWAKGAFVEWVERGEVACLVEPAHVETISAVRYKVRRPTSVRTRPGGGIIRPLMPGDILFATPSDHPAWLLVVTGGYVRRSCVVL